MNSYQSTKEIESLSALVDSWRYRKARMVDPNDREDLNARELDRLIHNALCYRDAKFFTALAQACEFDPKCKRIDPVDSLKRAYFNFCDDCKPTWQDVVDLAQEFFGLDSKISKRHLRRLRREAQLGHLLLYIGVLYIGVSR